MMSRGRRGGLPREARLLALKRAAPTPSSASGNTLRWALLPASPTATPPAAGAPCTAPPFTFLLLGGAGMWGGGVTEQSRRGPTCPRPWHSPPSTRTTGFTLKITMCPPPWTGTAAHPHAPPPPSLSLSLSLSSSLCPSPSLSPLGWQRLLAHVLNSPADKDHMTGKVNQNHTFSLNNMASSSNSIQFK